MNAKSFICAIVALLFSINLPAQVGVGIIASSQQQAGEVAQDYLTWGDTGSDLEIYNDNKGMRKIAGAGTGWSTPTLDDASAQANETFESGDVLVVKIGAVPDGPCALIISNDASPNMGGINGVDYGIYAGYGLTATVYSYEVNAPGGSNPAISENDLVRVTYGANMVFEHSTNNGASWSTIFTSLGTPSGSYNIHFQAYSALAGFKEIYKQ